MRVIAIDGPAGSGKSTVAKAVAQRLDLQYLDTGAMYRSVAYAVLRAGGDPADAELAANTARTIDLDVGLDIVMVNGVDASVEIRGSEVTRAVGIVAANPAVRVEMVSRQREWAERRGGGVLEGRDIGTVVFPDAELKVYLTADPEERARRRAKEVENQDLETVAADVGCESVAGWIPRHVERRSVAHGVHRTRPGNDLGDQTPSPVVGTKGDDGGYLVARLGEVVERHRWELHAPLLVSAQPCCDQTVVVDRDLSTHDRLGRAPDRLCISDIRWRIVPLDDGALAVDHDDGVVLIEKQEKRRGGFV